MTRREPAPRPGTRWYYAHRRRLIGIDLLMVTGAITATYLLKFGDELTTEVGGTGVPYVVAGLMVGLLLMGALGGTESRSRRILGAGLEEYRRVIRACFVVFGGVAVVSYLLGAQLSRKFFLTTLPLAVLMLLVGRWAARCGLNNQRRGGAGLTPTLVVGSLEDLAGMVEDMRRRPDAGYLPVAVASTDAALTPEGLDGLDRVSFQDVSEWARTGRVEAVAVTSGLTRGEARRLAWDLEDCRTHLMFAPGLTDVTGPRIHFTDAQGLELVHVDLPRFSGWHHLLKRAFDIAVATAALVILSPVLLLVALTIKLDDGGPVLYRQERIGLGGRTFTIHKFRSMRIDADRLIDRMIDEAGGKALLFKVENDPRITRVGRFLRRYSLDELPQFWTVLRGAMSIVGPRPQVAREVAEYTDAAHRRLLVKPGITGLWQVNGRSNLSVEESVRLDLRYVENWSLLGDLIIILKTVKVVLQPKGAY
ncbi:sugar transferase [Raineyella sp.]|uniref:sugar transferase n=1 Tax=Raineyella sp. TaxID=1911550 RepID=UPI002B216D84|nr:sugar transferase [Raineyella sp.]MEA5153333.1 sugar transferase [Raineyella sp.]